MRWFWIDKFVQFEPGKHARAVKNVSQAEEHLHDHFPGYPIMPASLVIEGMAQTAGILVGHARDFKENVILAKVQQATFHGVARPGDQLVYDAHLERIDDDGASVRGCVTRDDQPFAEIDIIFSHVGENQSELDLPQKNFVFDRQFDVLVGGYQLDKLGPQPGQQP
ncbi:MAG TPA: 3-hydroxyacyl-ACP dehydratase FabZ family protein [Phycisphaerae bacterium]|nr:3-hydroxyacyl-ACP dehydratase FabZ family protein [Phycisphaerae bacterium]